MSKQLCLKPFFYDKMLALINTFKSLGTFPTLTSGNVIYLVWCFWARLRKHGNVLAITDWFYSLSMTPLQLQRLYNFGRDEKIMNAAGIGICIDAIQAPVEILLQHLPEATEENYELGHNKRSITRPTFVYKFQTILLQ